MRPGQPGFPGGPGFAQGMPPRYPVAGGPPAGPGQPPQKPGQYILRLIFPCFDI